MMKKRIGALILLSGLFFVGNASGVFGQVLTPSVVDASLTWPAGTSFGGFVSTTDDPLGPFLGEAVHFRGTEEGGVFQVYRYRLDFDEPVMLRSVLVEGAAWAGGAEVPTDVIRLFDEGNNLISEVDALAGSNQFQSVVIPGNGALGRTFFLEEVNGDGSWRYRSNIVVDYESAPEPDVVMEAGKATVNHKWTTVALTESFTDPVVVAGPASWRGHQPATVRVRNVTPSSFQIRIDEWDYLDGRHVREEVDYLVVERGRHGLPSGAHVEAGSLVTNATKRMERVDFMAPFASAPVVASSVVSHNGGDAVVTRVADVSPDGFLVRMQEQEASGQWHVAEEVSFVAWSIGESGPGDTLTWETLVETAGARFTAVGFNGTYGEPPCVIGNMNTVQGGDPANLRWKHKTTSGIAIQVDEEQSADRETWHRAETIGLVTIECTP